jgi:hypothetical protein
MVNLYRWLLFLYPAAYRHEFAREMTLVFCQNEEATRTEGLAMRIAFCVRELSGLLSGALREQIRNPCWLLRLHSIREDRYASRASLSAFHSFSDVGNSCGGSACDLEGHKH